MEENRYSDPREIVEVYRQNLPQEVVETYIRPLPKCMYDDGAREDAAWYQLRRKRRRRNLLVFLLCLTAAVSLGAGAWFLREEQSAPPVEFYPPKQQEITISSYPTDPDMSFRISLEETEPLTIQEVYRKVNPSVVTVMVQLEERNGYNQLGVGTGVIFTSDGYIVTNYHNLEGGAYCTVATDTGEIYQAEFVAGDAENDLAVLKIDGKDLPAATFGNSNDLQVGDTVYAIGNPLGVELRGTLTDGIVSAINRDVWVDGVTMTLIQTNAALNKGNSGGPLINRCGQVVGINVIKMVGGHEDDTVEGLGFAIPMASAERIITDLVRCGEVQPPVSLGLQVLRAGEEVAEGIRGILVQSADVGGAGEAAGILAGDYVIHAGGIDISNSEDLLLARDRYYAGEQFPMRIWRAGEILEFSVALAANAD